MVILSESLSVTSEESTNGTSAVCVMSLSLTNSLCVPHRPIRSPCDPAHSPSIIVSCVIDSSIDVLLTVCLSVSLSVCLSVCLSSSPVGGLLHLHLEPPDQTLTPPSNTHTHTHPQLVPHVVLEHKQTHKHTSEPATTGSTWF